MGLLGVECERGRCLSYDRESMRERGREVEVLQEGAITATKERGRRGWIGLQGEREKREREREMERAVKEEDGEGNQRVHSQVASPKGREGTCVNHARLHHYSTGVNK